VKSGELTYEVAQIEDSRGQPTLCVKLSLGNAVGIGDVPAGASTGEDEAKNVSVTKAIKNIEQVLMPLVIDANADLRRHESLCSIEEMILDKAGDNCELLGANAVVPVSRALWQLAASLRNQSLASYIRKYEPTLASRHRVHLFMNIFNGGLHALQQNEDEVLGRDRIDIQEVMVVPVMTSNYREALQIGERIDATLKDTLNQRYGANAVTRADEAGFSVKGLGSSELAIAHVIEAIERAGYQPGVQVRLALDMAASSFYDKTQGHYTFQGQQLSSEAMIKAVLDIVDRYPDKILSIEDPLDENDWEAWGVLSKELDKRGVITIGDDLFVTQKKRLVRGINNNSANAVLIKVNQNGSMRGTLDVMKYAKDKGLRCVVSHRSGETLDVSIADLAFATGAFGLKSGDPQPVGDFPNPETWVRRRKYLRLIELEEQAR
jgi:enolase